MRWIGLIVPVVVALPVAVSAHVTVEPKAATPGPFKAVFSVPHGCSGSPTTAVRITIPDGVIGVKPMPKPGWTLSVTKGPYARPYDYFHGTKLANGATEIAWSGGNLPDDQADEFALIGFISDAFKTGTIIPFKVMQTCETGSVSWAEVPAAGADPHATKTPAPSIKVRSSSDVTRSR